MYAIHMLEEDKMTKKAQGMSINTIIIAIIALIVLVVVILLFTGKVKFAANNMNQESCTSRGGRCVANPTDECTSVEMSASGMGCPRKMDLSKGIPVDDPATAIYCCYPVPKTT
jgi:hypothetical protein